MTMKFLKLGKLAAAVLSLIHGAVLAQALQFVHPDHLNTPRVITNQAGQVVWRWDQTEPFGADPPNENPSGLGTFIYNLRLPGQHFDKETNLHYNYFRDYDPGIGRYVQSDPIGLPGGINTYAYANLNPLSYVDPTGEWFFLLFGLALGGGSATTTTAAVGSLALVGGTAYILSQSNKPTGGSNVIPFPGVQQSSSTYCPRPEDPCEKERRDLEKNKTATISLYTIHIKNPIRAAQQYNIAATLTNRWINLHNIDCPNHKVDQLPLQPIGPT
jgi:RHS repeat-associated protein